MRGALCWVFEGLLLEYSGVCVRKENEGWEMKGDQLGGNSDAR